MASAGAPIPAVCFDVCNNAFLQAQEEGKTPALCEPGSEFIQLYNSCATCIQDNSGSQSIVDLAPEFAQILQYCEGLGALTYVTMTTTLFPTVSPGGVVAVPVTFTMTKVKTGYMGAVNTTTTSSALSTLPSSSSQTAPSPTFPPSTSPPSTTPSPTSTSLPTGKPDSNRAWIAGPVVGSVVVLVLLACLGYWVRRRREQQKRRDTGYDKPELHGEALPRKAPAELEAKLPPTELEAKQPPTELFSGDIRSSEVDSHASLQGDPVELSANNADR